MLLFLSHDDISMCQSNVHVHVRFWWAEKDFSLRLDQCYRYMESEALAAAAADAAVCVFVGEPLD